MIVDITGDTIDIKDGVGRHEDTLSKTELAGAEKWYACFFLNTTLEC